MITLNGNVVDGVRLRRARNRHDRAPRTADTRFVGTPHARVRVRDTGGDGPVIVMAPDGPCVIEHHAALIAALRTRARVVCLDLPGFGFSFPTSAYRHTLDDGVAAVLAVMDALEVPRATLAFTCANGFYAMALARRAPRRVAGLALAQTPSVAAMLAWTDRTIWAPVRWPVVGQAMLALAPRRIADLWFANALPRGVDPAVFQATSRRAFEAGACFCLAGVVQGLQNITPASLGRLDVPAVVAWGDGDRTHRKTSPTSILDHLPGARVEVFSGRGHFPGLEDTARFATLAGDAARAWG